MRPLYPFPLARLLVVAVLLWLPLLAPAQTPAPPPPNLVPDSTELRVLRQLYYSTGGPGWTRQSGWLRGTTLADVAQWQNLRVENGDVVALSLEANNLTGGIPACLGQLRALRELSLGQNALPGPIPAALGALTQLRGLALPQNRLSGPIPRGLGQLRALQNLNLADNQLSGPLPAELAGCTSLTALALVGNQLSGPLPGWLSQLSQLQTLNLAANQFSGPIPASLGQLRQLVELVADGNRLSGELPPTLGRLARLRTLRLSLNQLAGGLPDSLARLGALQTLDLTGNQLSGPLPAGYGALTNLYSLSLTGNQFTGPLPASWGQLRGLWRLELSRNRLSGPIPASWAQLSGLRQCFLARNQLSGPLPPALGQLRELALLDADHNQLSGSIPATFKRIKAFYRLDLSANQLTGPIPDSLRASYLLLGDNHLSGVVPATLNFYQLLLDRNDITKIPDYDSRLGWPILELGLTGNFLDFGSYEPNQWEPGVYQFWDYGQRTPGPADTLTGRRGTRLQLRRQTGGTHNAYQWQRRAGSAWLDVAGARTLTLALGPLDESQEGEYRVRVTNSWVPGITIYTRSVYVNLLPYAPLALNEPTDEQCPAPPSGPLPVNRPVGQTDPVNYVRTYVARAAVTDAAALRANWRARPREVSVSTEYLDGLGRPVQTVQHGASPTGRDLVQLRQYDALGREPKQFLPYSAAPATADGVGYHPDALAEQGQFYRGQGRDPLLPQLTAPLPKTGVAYAETAFEASPLNRPLAQASAGESGQLGAGHEVVLSQRPNLATDSVPRWEPGYGAQREELTYRGAYAAGTLWVQQTRDEQGQWRQTFTDQQGRVVLSQVGTNGSYDRPATSWLKTCYVYDDFGRRRATVPPLAGQRLRQNKWQVSGAGVERLLLREHYDARGRPVERQVPDQAGYAYTLYNALDQPILTQDVSQQAAKEWVARKYDALGREVYAGLVRFADLTGSASQQREQLLTWQANWQAQHAGVPLWEEPAARPTLGRAYYSARTWPALTAPAGGAGGAELLRVSYYDHYDFNQDGQPDARYQPPTAAALAGGPADAMPAVDLRVTGQLTRTLTRVLGRAAGAADAWLSSTTFFDERLRPIQVQSTNARGGSDVVSTRYDFAGQVLASYATHQVPGQPARAVGEQRAYDPAGRLLAVSQALAGAPAQVLARPGYNELGQLAQKQLGGQLAPAGAGGAVSLPAPGPGPKPWQTVDFRYNIRGWLTNINDVEAVAPADGDLWSLALHYECGFAQPQYNGNLAGQRWRSAADGVQRAYGYRYDALNRLLQGDYVARPAGAAGWGAERGNYRFSAASYDANGNLRTLRRRGLVAAATRRAPAQYGETDNLRYRYAPGPGEALTAEPTGNRLLRVDDLAAAAPPPGRSQPARPDFSDGPTNGSLEPDYSYDAAGSLTSDKNKGLTKISYNYLHLPVRLEWQNGDVLEYTYAASGQKVGKRATATGQAPVRTDYLGPWQYEGDTLRWLTHAEGRALYLYKKDLAGQPSTRVVYEYTIKDHLGNLRVAFHPGERLRYSAGLDSSPEQTRREQRSFDSLSVSAPVRQPVGAQFARSGDGVALLHAGGVAPQPLGPLKQLPVSRGDTIDVVAYGMYQQPTLRPTWGFTLASFVAGLLQPPAPGLPVPDGGRRPRVLPLLSVGLALAPAVPQLAGGVPKAYVRVLVYNADSALVDTKTKQLTSSALNGYETLSLRVLVPVAGYVQAYVANESDTDVFFDDISVEHRQGLQVQENHYDPFGLDLVGVSRLAARPQNKFSWNGKEQQTEFGLNWHDHGWRFYDPALGRWVVTDPDGEEGGQESWTSYQFGLDNAVRYNDLDGRQAGPGDGVLDNPGFLTTLARGLAALGSVTVAPEVAVGILVTAIFEPLNEAGGGRGGRPNYVLDNGRVYTSQAEYDKASGRVQAQQAKPTSHQTYTKKNEKTGETYSGKTSGKGTPRQNVANRDNKPDHKKKNEEGYGPAKLDKSSSNKEAIRGREQNLIDANGGAKSQGGTSGNKINGIREDNKRRQEYLDAAKKEFGN